MRATGADMTDLIGGLMKLCRHHEGHHFDIGMDLDDFLYEISERWPDAICDMTKELYVKEVRSCQPVDASGFVDRVARESERLACIRQGDPLDFVLAVYRTEPEPVTYMSFSRVMDGSCADDAKGRWFEILRISYNFRAMDLEPCWQDLVMMHEHTTITAKQRLWDQLKRYARRMPQEQLRRPRSLDVHQRYEPPRLLRHINGFKLRVIEYTSKLLASYFRENGTKYRDIKSHMVPQIIYNLTS